MGKPITNLPKLDTSKCSGSGLCLSNCPGLAIYIKDYTYSENQALITFPYEFYPLPSINQIVMAVDREGKDVCEGVIVKINLNMANDHTIILSMVYPKDYFHEVISMKRVKG